MAESVSPGSAPGSEQSPLAGDPALRELRELLFGPKIQQIDEVRDQVFDTSLHAHRVGRVLPQAISLRAAQDEDLAEALQSTVEQIIRTSVKRKPEILIDVLFPIIGSAIRRSIAAAFRDMLQSISRTLDASFSPRSLKWRLEAFRTGKSFAEVVLLHTMYRVEQIFVIHRSNGLLLDHVVAAEAASQDPDLVSAMLTAIRDFVRDSFGGSTTTDAELETLQVGELTIWIEPGPQAILAAVIRGSAPSEFRHKLQETLEKFHLDHAEDLSSFRGDSSVFASSRPNLEACLESRFEDGGRSGGISPVVWVLPALLFLLLGYWLVSSWRENHRWTSFVERLDNQAGIVVARAEKRGGRFRLTGLKDPLSSDPRTLFEQAGFDPALLDQRWEPFIALDPGLVESRARQRLAPPEGVSFQYVDGVLRAEGEAKPEWIEAAEKSALSVPGVTGFDFSSLGRPHAEKIRAAIEEIQQVRLLFPLQGAEPLPEELAKLPGLARRIESLVELAKSAGGKVRLFVRGHVDNSGPPDLNQDLKDRRARTVARLLRENGIAESEWLEILPSEEGEQRLERSVSFEAVYSDVP